MKSRHVILSVLPPWAILFCPTCRSGLRSKSVLRHSFSRVADSLSNPTCSFCRTAQHAVWAVPPVPTLHPSTYTQVEMVSVRVSLLRASRCTGSFCFQHGLPALSPRSILDLLEVM